MMLPKGLDPNGILYEPFPEIVPPVVTKHFDFNYWTERLKAVDSLETKLAEMVRFKFLFFSFLYSYIFLF